MPRHAHKHQVMAVGVYFDDQRHTALVYAARSTVVDVVLMGPIIEHRTMHAQDFVREYPKRWPAYPLRRAARMYLNSQLEKSETAKRALRLILASE